MTQPSTILDPALNYPRPSPRLPSTQPLITLDRAFAVPLASKSRIVSQSLAVQRSISDPGAAFRPLWPSWVTAWPPRKTTRRASLQQLWRLRRVSQLACACVACLFSPASSLWLRQLDPLVGCQGSAWWACPSLWRRQSHRRWSLHEGVQEGGVFAAQRSCGGRCAVDPSSVAALFLFEGPAS